MIWIGPVLIGCWPLPLEVKFDHQFETDEATFEIVVFTPDSESGGAISAPPAS